MRTSKGLFGLVAVGVASLLVVSACGGGGKSTGNKSSSAGFADCATKPNTCNSGTTKQGGTFTYTIEKTISGWNLNNADSNTFEFAEVLDGVLPGVFNTNPDFSPFLNADLMVSAEQTSSSPQTIVYKIQPSAVWNDGTPVTADDFIYQWQTMDGIHCTDCSSANPSGYDQIDTIEPSDNGKTVTVKFKKAYTDWKSLFGGMYPAHVAKQHGDLAASFKWFDENTPNYSAGPYQISGYDKDTSITLTPNQKWYGKVKPSLDKLVFRIITDQSQEVPALQNNEVQAIYPQPNKDLVDQVKQISGVQAHLGAGLTWEHLDLNLKNPLLDDAKLRQAMFVAVNRKEIIDKTIGQFMPGAQPLNSHNFVPGEKGYKDVVTSTGQGVGDVAKAKQMLTEAGYKDVGTALKNPSGAAINFRCSFTQGNVLRQQSCELLQNELGQLGIKITPTPIAELGKTLTSGDYDMIIFAWIGTPYPFSGAQQLWGSKSDSNYGHWTNAQSDTLLADASGQLDPQKAIDDLNQADSIMSADAYVLPLFQKPTYLAVYSNMVNIRDNATSVGPPYNVQEWGLAS
jgi:peptide/nickel transport system substrate-binding protein